MTTKLFNHRGVLGLLLCLSLVGNASAQNGKPRAIEGQLPEITPPAPTVGNLMKFEEVPVNNYTGIPDITIPLYSVDTHSSDVNVNIALKYHPSSVAVLETASYTGLGWSLFAGGAISRTVKGSPDELAVFGTNQRIGLLQDNISDTGGWDAINRYNQVIDLLGTPLSGDEITMIGHYGWNVSEVGSMDTEYDLYQYNFMGYTGRFTIKRDPVTQMLVPVKLDNDNNMKIMLNYSQSYSSYQHKYNYVFFGFDLFDDKGFKYSFTVKEATEEFDDIRAEAFQAGSGDLSPSMMEYTSAYNLTEIYDNNNKLLAKFNYTDAVEEVKIHNESYNWMPYTNNGHFYNLGGPNSGLDIHGLLPQLIIMNNTTRTITKKLSLIEVIDKAKINFYTDLGREDTNINSDAPKLNSIIISNWFGEKVKQYRFEYDYLTIQAGQNSLSRLGLSRIVEKDCRFAINSVEGQELVHTFTYEKPIAYSQIGLKRDYWGYFSQRLDGSKETDEEYCSTHVLERIMYPTGGSVVFDFGPNTYSHIGNKMVDNFSIDDDNYNFIDIEVPADGEFGITQYLPTTERTNLFFIPKTPVEGGTFNINSGDRNLQPINVLGDNTLNDGTARTATYSFEPNFKYAVSYKVPAGMDNTLKATVRMFFDRSNPPTTGDNQWLMGGGLRINKISYYTDAITSAPSKEKHFNYNFIDPAYSNMSSGSLVSPKPLYRYYQYASAYATGGGSTGSIPQEFGIAQVNPQGVDLTPNNPGGGPGIFTIMYGTDTQLNNLKYIRTKGADVGYQNVTVYETGNGKSEYVYTSPISYPEAEYIVTPPFRYPLNYDYKRGLLQKETHYKEGGLLSPDRPVSEEIYEYYIINEPEGTSQYEGFAEIGHRMDASPSPMASTFTNFESFRACVNSNCGDDWGISSDDDFYLSLGEQVREYFGWPVLKKKISNAYFYPAASPAQIVSTTEEYEYDFSLKKLKSSSANNSQDEILKTLYFYDTNNSGRNRIGVLKGMESYRGANLLDKKSITFSNTAWGINNTSFLPKTISIAKGTATPEPKVQFLRYDQYGNLLEAKLENGKTICYVWGYFSSYPIAIIENMEYATLMNHPTWQLYVNYSRGDTNNNNSLNPLIYFNALREEVPNDVSVTTFVYKPLVGVTATIDPRGNKTTYSYDGFGRLEEVREKEFDGANAGEAGNLISKNKYNFRPISN
jgi:hypothetical protein